MFGTMDDWLLPCDSRSPAYQAAAARLRQSGAFVGDLDELLALRVEQIGKIEGFRDVVIHAHTNIGPGEPVPTFFIRTRKGDMAIPVEQLAKEIEKLELWDGEGVRLIACGGGSSGMKGISLADDLARLLERRVMAADAPVAIATDGSLRLISPVAGWRIIEP